MSPTGIHFGCPPTPVTTELRGKREGEKTHWEGEEKTNVFCILLSWLAQAYAWNRCSVNTWGMYVQMNEKRELASRHLGKEKKTWESWQIFPEYASTTSISLCTGYIQYPSSLFQDIQTGLPALGSEHLNLSAVGIRHSTAGLRCSSRYIQIKPMCLCEITSCPEIKHSVRWWIH